MSKTAGEYIDSVQSEFRKLSASRQSTLRREAHKYIRKFPHMANANGFWRGLSALQVIEA